MTVLYEPAGAPHLPLHLPGVQLPTHPSHQAQVLSKEPGDGSLGVGATLVVAVALSAEIAVLHDSSVHLNIDSIRSKADLLERYKNWEKHLHRPRSSSVFSGVAREELVVAGQTA